MKTLLILLITLFITVVIPVASSHAQTGETEKHKKSKAEKEAEQENSYGKIASLVNSKQFVFQANFDQGSDMVYVVLDSTHAEVQNGNRNNLEGRVTQCDIKMNGKSKTISVTIKLRGQMYNADVFLFIDAWGEGRATVNCEFPGSFAFDGFIVDFENTNIYQGGAHLVY